MLIAKLSKNINDQNYYDIIIFLQKNKFDSNNAKIDEIIKEKDERKKEELIKNLKIDDAIDFSSSGYAAQLFSIFNNNIYFCLRENKESECIICGNKKTEEITNMQPFIFINGNNINNTSTVFHRDIRLTWISVKLLSVNFFYNTRTWLSVTYYL